MFSIFNLLLLFGICPIRKLTGYNSYNFIFHQIDIVICGNLDFSTTSIFGSTISISVLRKEECCPITKEGEKNYILSHSTIIFWLPDNNKTQVTQSSLMFLQKCVKRRKLFLSLRHTTYHIVVSKYEFEENNISSYLKQEVVKFLEPPNELFLCNNFITQFSISCIELYHIKSTIIFRPVKDLETIIFGNSQKYFDFLGETIPAVVLNMKGHGRNVNGKNVSNEPFEISGKSNLNRYRYIRDSLNFTEMGKISTLSFSRNAETDTLENTGLAEFINSEKAIWTNGIYEFAPYRMKGKYGLRYLHATISKLNPIVIFVQPKDEDNDLHKRPFHSTVWFTLLPAILIIMGIFTTVSCRNRFNTGDTSILSVLSNATWCTIESLVLKVNDTILANHTKFDTISRLFICTILFFVFIMQGIYTSKLTSIFTINFDRIQTFQHLKDDGFQTIVKSNAPYLKSLLVYLDNNENVEEGNILDVFSKMLNSKVALLTSTIEFKTFLPSEYVEEFLCEKLYLAKVSHFPIKSAHMVKQQSPFRNVFNIKLLHLIQSGNDARITKDLIQDSSLICPAKEKISFHSVTIKNTELVFVFLLLAVGASMLALIMEYLFKRNNGQRVIIVAQ